MTLAAKHGDPQLGVDIHMCTVPPGTPVPLPTPHMSFVFDPFDYVPFVGATVTVCGMKRATAGTSGKVVHIPPGFPFAPKMPDTEDELFMGSATVIADSEPFSYIGLPVLSCQVAGMPSPGRVKKKGAPRACLLPTIFNMAIPTNVFVGGPPTISMMGMAFKAGFSGLGKLAKSQVFKRIRQKLFKNMKPGALKCMILRAEPVNILTGEVSVEHEDFSLPGRLPIEWSRSYSSSGAREGVCGVGWETAADGRLEIDPRSGTVSLHFPAVGPLYFDRLPLQQGRVGAELELMDGALLADGGDYYAVRTKEDQTYRFPKAGELTRRDGIREVPLGQIADLAGNTLQFTRHSGQLTGIVEAAGRRLELEIVDGRLRQVVLQSSDRRDRHVFVRYQYDAAGDLVAAIDALGKLYAFAYDAHRMVRHTDRNGLSFHYAYDKSGEDWRVEHAWGDGGLYDYRFVYIDAINERRITDSLGHVSVVKLNEQGLPINEIDPLNGITIYEYDDCGRTTAVVDPGGRRTEYAYDERGNLLKLTRPDGASIQTEFDQANKAVSIIDPNGAQWQQIWDSRGLLVEQVTPLGNVSRYEYDAQAQLVAFINPRGARTELNFDGVGNLACLTDALGYRTRFTYDLLGNVTRKLDPLDHETVYRYDLKGRLTDLWLPSGATISCGYDGEDNLTHYVDENGAATRLEYFGQGEIKRRLQPDGHSVEYHYDSEERLIGVTNQRRETYQLKRDVLGRIVEEVDYWGQARRCTYDASGYLTSSTDPLGRKVKYATDPLGRVLKKTLPDGFVETFAYDAIGNLVEAANPHGEIKRVFDGEGRLSEEGQGEFTIRNTYDANGNRVARDTSLGNSIAYAFDLLDQVSAIRINDGEPIRIERNADGSIASEQLNPKLSRRYQYSVDGYLTEQEVTANASLLFATAFSYDAAGNLTQRSDSQYGTDTYRYDQLGRITEHLDPQNQITRYLNDPAGDRLRTRIVEGTRQRVAIGGVVDNVWSREGQCGGTCYRFDRAGNLVERRDGKRELYLASDANQRLVGSQADGTVTRYGYDPLGRRLFKETGALRTLFFWDGDALVGEAVVALDQQKEPIPAFEGIAISKRGEIARSAIQYRVREHVYYPESFEPSTLIEGAEGARRVYLYHNDPNGCPTRLTDAGGDVMWGVGYTAWGGVTTLCVKEIENPIRLQGQYSDGETGLYYNRYRYFNPELGAFTSPDPLGVLAGEKFYFFAPNTLSWIDPLGLACRIASRTPGGLAIGRKISEKQALQRLRRGLDVFADSISEAKSLAKRVLKGRAGHDLPHGSGYLPHFHPGDTHGIFGHVFHP